MSPLAGRMRGQDIRNTNVCKLATCQGRDNGNVPHFAARGGHHHRAAAARAGERLRQEHARANILHSCTSKAHDAEPAPRINPRRRSPVPSTGCSRTVPLQTISWVLNRQQSEETGRRGATFLGLATAGGRHRDRCAVRDGRASGGLPNTPWCPLLWCRLVRNALRPPRGARIPTGTRVPVPASRALKIGTRAGLARAAHGRPTSGREGS